MTTEDLELYKLLGFTDKEIIKADKSHLEIIRLYKFITGNTENMTDYKQFWRILYFKLNIYRGN